jgi:hypothetical protein
VGVGQLSPELEQIRRDVERLTHGWSEPDWRYAPRGKWTCGQILEHLFLTFTVTTKGIRNMMETGRPLAGKATLPDRLRTICVAKLGLMPMGRLSPPQTIPKGGWGKEALPRFYDSLVALDATLDDAQRRFGSGAKLLDHPALGPLSAKEWRQFHRTHAKHHLRQIAQLAEEAGSRPAHRQYSH